MKMVGWLIGAGIIVLIALVAPVHAVSVDGFTLNIIHNNKPLREIDGRVTIPFDEEYQILLKNENKKRCVAKVFVDGTLVSNLGDFVIKKELKLERFVTESLKEGPAFKFVPLDDPGVQDPSNSDNGLIRVEFRLEKEIEQYIIPQEEEEYRGSWFYWNGQWYRIYISPNTYEIDSCTIRTYGTTDFQISNESNFIPCSSVQPGATIEGSLSHQRFYHIDIELENEFVVLELRIVGIKLELIP